MKKSKNKDTIKMSFEEVMKRIVRVKPEELKDEMEKDKKGKAKKDERNIR